MAGPEIQVAEKPAVSRRAGVWRSRLLFPVLILLIVAGFYWKLTLTKQYDWVWGPDLAQQVLPWFEEEARQVQQGQIPLWDPHGWLGQPMLGQAQPGTAYPLNWILFRIPKAHGHIRPVALAWYYVMVHFMAAFFCYLLCRDLGRSRAASLMGGLIFSLAGYVGTTDWPQMVNGAVWAPLVFLFLLRAARGRRPLASAALCGSCLGMAWLAGHHQVPIYITLAMGGMWLYYSLRRGAIDWNMVKLAAVSLIFMVLVGAVQILPAEEYGHLAKRWAGADHELTWNEPVPYYVHQEYSLGAASLFAIVIPGVSAHADPFIGVVAFSLLLLAVALAWKQHAVKLFAAAAIGSIIYALGFNSVFQGFLYAVVPLVDKARVPSMAVVIFDISAAVLAAFGADQASRSMDSQWGRRLTTGVLAFGVGLYALVLSITYGRKSFDMDDRIMITATVAVLMAALLYGWRSGNLTSRQAFTWMILLMLFELGNDSGYSFPHRHDKERIIYLEQVRSNADLAGFIHKQPGLFRVEAKTDKLSTNWGSYQNFDIVQAMCASLTTNVLDLDWHTWQSKLLLGVRYTVSEKPPLGDSKDVFTGQSGLKVFENPNAFPRAWAVHEIDRADLGSVRTVINDHLEQMLLKAFTQEKLPPLKPCSRSDDVKIAGYTAESVSIAANMGCDGMVILSDTYFPGWRARVDGKPAEIHEVDNALRGVYVSQGKHELTMEYRPRSVYLGALLTSIGLLGALGLAVFWKRD
jgi:hypothetical protein